MISESLIASKRALEHLPLTLAAIAVYALFGLAIGPEFLDDPDAQIALAIPAAFGSFVVLYQMSRRAGAPREGEVGSVGRWFGWGIVSALPMVVLLAIYVSVVGFDYWVEAATPLWMETATFIVATIIVLPITALATGRAIDRDGLTPSAVFAFCTKAAWPIIIGGLAFLVLPNFLSDGLLTGFGAEEFTQLQAILFGLTGGTAMFAGQMLLIGLSATIYRAAEQAAAT